MPILLEKLGVRHVGGQDEVASQHALQLHQGCSRGCSGCLLGLSSALHSAVHCALLRSKLLFKSRRMLPLKSYRHTATPAASRPFHSRSHLPA